MDSDNGSQSHALRVNYQSQHITLSYTYPEDNMQAPLVFDVFYYGVAIPVSYVGNLFTYIIVCKLLKYRNSTSDVLVGGLALNDVLTAFIVFTPALISAARGQYFDNKVMCEFSAVTTVWYLYTTFAMIVLNNAERWLAITKPFQYKRLHVTGFKLKAIMTVQGFFCLMLASIPLIRYPVALKAGWYCAPVDITHASVPAAMNGFPIITSTASTATTTTTTTTTITNNNNNDNLTASIFNATAATAIAAARNNFSGNDVSELMTKTTPAMMVVMTLTDEMRPVQETIFIKLIYLVVGISILVGCNVSIACTLGSRNFGDAASREMDRKFGRIMGVVAGLFLLTWLPNMTAQAACLAKSRVCQEFEFWAMRIVNIGVAVNPVVYGVMKTTYRRGYLYLARVTLHYLTFTLVPLPAYGEEIFDLRERYGSKRRPITLATPQTPTVSDVIPAFDSAEHRDISQQQEPSVV